MKSKRPPAQPLVASSEEFSLSGPAVSDASPAPSKLVELNRALRAARKRAHYWSNVLNGYSPRSRRDVRTNYAGAMADAALMARAIESLTGKRPRCSDPAPAEQGQSRLAL